MFEFLQINIPFASYLENGIVLLFASFVSIISVSNPLSSMPVFTSLTDNNTKTERKKIAQKAAFYMFLILTVFLSAGTYIINFFGISLSGIQVAGGIIIAHAGWGMLTPGEHLKMTDVVKKSAKEKDDVSFTPLAMPFLAGPGSISVVIGLSLQVDSIMTFIFILLAIILSAIVAYIIFRLGPLSTKYIGPTGMSAFTRMMGFIVMAIAVQFVLNGIKGFFMI